MTKKQVGPHPLKTMAVSAIASVILVFSFDGSAQLNPDTAGVDLNASSHSASDTTRSEASMKASCYEQWAGGARAYNSEFCKKKCAAGEKRFCACAKDTCTRFENEFQAEAEAARKAKEKADAEAATSTSAAIDSNGKCDIADSQLPKIEGYGPDRYVGNLQEGETSKVAMLKKRCLVGQNLTSCKVLCKVGCKQYCNYCEIGKNADTRYKNKYFHGRYAFLEQSMAPHPDPDHYESNKARIIHNCNPATKKRGVGIIPGGAENFIGLGYGQFGWCKGYCNELLSANWRPLRLAFDAGDLGSKEEYDGVPTNLEMIWAGGHIRMCDGFFKKWNYPIIKGSSRDNPLRPGDHEYDDFYHLIAIQPGLQSYRIPPYSNGFPRYLCGDPTWIDSTGDAAHQRGLKEKCRSGHRSTCRMLCNRGQGYEEFCETNKELSDVGYCERYGKPGTYQNVASCKKLCATGKPEYQKYCP